MKIKCLSLALILALGSVCHASTSQQLERYFRQMGTPKKLAFSEGGHAGEPKTQIKLLSCSNVNAGHEKGYGVCTFQAFGYMLRGVYSVIVNPDGTFQEKVEIGDFAG